MKHLVLTTIILTACSAMLLAVTPAEVFNDGLRAFNNGRYAEAEESFQRFIETWPTDKLANDAMYYSSIACARSLKNRRSEAIEAKLTELENNLMVLAKECPEADLTELKVALGIAKSETKPVNWQHLNSLSYTELKHYINRGWYPKPSKNPMQTLSWLNSCKGAKGAVEPALSAKLSLIKAQALFKLALSPLALHENSNELKALGYKNIHSALEASLKAGFNTAEPTVKKQIALLGYHFDALKQNGLQPNFLPNTQNKWYTYLKERGLALQKAYCP